MWLILAQVSWLLQLAMACKVKPWEIYKPGVFFLVSSFFFCFFYLDEMLVNENTIKLSLESLWSAVLLCYYHCFLQFLIYFELPDSIHLTAYFRSNEVLSSFCSFSSVYGYFQCDQSSKDMGVNIAVWFILFFQHFLICFRVCFCCWCCCFSVSLICF